MLITVRGGDGEANAPQNPVQCQGFPITAGGSGDGQTPQAMFPMLIWGRKRLRGLDCGFPLERKRNSLEATKEQLIHNSFSLKKTNWGLGRPMSSVGQGGLGTLSGVRKRALVSRPC